jgi:hypothetical protein
MDRKGTWILAAAIVAGFLVLGLTQAVAQRDFRTEPRSADGAPHRYVVVNVTEGEIIIMDTTTGDLYSAKPKDVKPYDARPRPPRLPAEVEKPRDAAVPVPVPVPDRDKVSPPEFKGSKGVPQDLQKKS